ncbi:MAG: peptide MFS transporter [Saprospiraceae bacterium]|nr:peptide MFS transporter [Saprospiraceae bacterium]
MSNDPRTSIGFFGHPKGLTTLFFTEMWERFSYYGMRALLILFMTAAASEGGLGFSDSKAAAVYGLYTCGVYLLALPGGWIADRIVGQRNAIWYGGIIIALGHFVLAAPMEWTFYIGLILIVVGTGLLKPNISTIVGELYPDKGARRDAGFSIFYMGINLGAFLGPLLCGYFAENVNWHLGFALAGIGMVLGLIQYKLTGPSTLGKIGTEPNIKSDEVQTTGGNNGMAIGLAVLTVVALGVMHSMGVIDLLTAEGLAEAVSYIIAIVIAFYFAYLMIAGGLNLNEKKRIIVIFLLVLGAAVFWSGFEQAGSALNLFAERYTDRLIGTWEMPASWLQSVNSFFIITLAPLFGALWIRLAQRNLNPRTPLKFGLGLIFLGLGFLVMYYAAQLVTEGTKAGMFFLIFTYFLHTAGELCLSPVGLSTTTKLAPKRFVGQMMGIWFVGTAFGNLIAGLVASRFDPSQVQQMPDLFMTMVMTAVGAGLFFIAASPILKKWMGEVQ